MAFHKKVRGEEIRPLAPALEILQFAERDRSVDHLDSDRFHLSANVHILHKHLEFEHFVSSGYRADLRDRLEFPYNGVNSLLVQSLHAHDQKRVLEGVLPW